MTPLLLIQQAIQQRIKRLSALVKYDPDQPRDEHGRWSNSGGSGGSGDAGNGNYDSSASSIPLDLPTNKNGDMYIYRGARSFSDTSETGVYFTVNPLLAIQYASSNPTDEVQRLTVNSKSLIDTRILPNDPTKEDYTRLFEHYGIHDTHEFNVSATSRLSYSEHDMRLLKLADDNGFLGYIGYESKSVTILLTPSSYGKLTKDPSMELVNGDVAPDYFFMSDRPPEESASAAKIKSKATASQTQAIERIARRLEPQLRKRFLAAVQATKDRVDLEALARAVQAGNVTQAEFAARLREWPEKYGELSIDLRAGFLAGGEVAYEVLDGAKFKLRFDLINPYAVNYANRKLPQIVESYKDDAKRIIRDIITEAVSGKYTVQTAAKEIRDSIGLTERYSMAAANYRADLIGNGITGERLEAKVERYKEKLLKSRAKTIARTEIIQAQVSGQRALWNEAANQGLFNKADAKRIWKVHTDERTCELCMAMDGQEIPFNGVYDHPELGNVNIFGDVLNGPPIHPNCIQKDTPISGMIIAGTRMLYSGSARHIVTRSGKSLTVTPNHPVLTMCGMQPAGLLNKGDNLLAYGIQGEPDSPSAIDMSFSTARVLPPLNVQDVPATAEQIFQSLVRSGSRVIVSQRTGLEFHGDALSGDGEIEVVYLDRPLGFNISDVERSEHGADFAFVASDSRHSSQRDTELVSSRVCGTLAIVGNTSSTATLPAQQCGVSSRAYFDATCRQLTVECVSRDTTFARQLAERFPETVLLDEIVEIHDVDLHEYVYDFQTISGLIVAHGLLISNCRCHEELDT